MTLLFVDGFDTKDTNIKWLLSATYGPPALTYTASTRFGVGFAVSAPDPSGSSDHIYLIKSITPSAQVFFGGAVKPVRQSGQTLSAPFHVLLGDTATTAHLYLTTTNLGAVQLWRGDPRVLYTGSSPYVPNGTMLATTANGVIDAAGTGWHYYELGATLATSGGTAQVQVDGVQVINFTGNTKNGGTSSNIDAVLFMSMLAKPSGSFLWLGSPIYDDVYVCNSSGSSNNTFRGDAKVQTSSPTSAGATTNLTPTGSSANWQNVSEIPDNTATYNSSAASGARDLYNVADLTVSTTSVFGVQQVSSMFKSDAGAATMKAAQRSGSTVSYGASNVLSTTPTVYVDMFETNPATSASWTVSDVNSLQIGAEVV